MTARARTGRRALAALALAAAAVGCPKADTVVAEAAPDYSKFASNRDCTSCHRKIGVQYNFSTHAAAFSDPVFQAQLYGQLLPLAQKDERLMREAKSCLKCHAPILWLQGGGEVVPADTARPGFAGVTCDFCHVVRGFTGDRPGNGNYVVTPGETKYGPFKDEGDFHRAYGELQTKSELCALCHSAQNTLGLDFRTTYEEWKASDFAAKGVQCQDCHMSAKGFLVDGVASYERGQAAVMTTVSVKEREKLFSHRFPGAHSASQMTGALQLQVAPVNERLKPGQRVSIEVAVDNSRAGHRMPTGSAELRLLWLEVTVGLDDDDANAQRLTARPLAAGQPLDVAGVDKWDAALLRDDVPAGSRVYRALFLDQGGQPTQTGYQMAKKAFDNRLQAGEVRVERFDYLVPDRFVVGEDLHVVATLKYLQFSSSFLQPLGIPPPLPAVIAETRALLGVTGVEAP